METMSTVVDEPVGSRAGRREWIGLAVIALPCVLYSMDLTVLNLAVPALTADLAPTSAQLLWIVDIYGFLVAGSLITMGTLGDRIGRRRLLMIGAAAFGVASVLAAFSRTAEMLIATRALLGVAGATLAPSTLSLIRNMFHHDDQRTFAIGIWATSYSVGGAIGPLAGGMLLQHFWWGSVFLAGVPVMLLLLIVGPKLLPEFRDPHAGALDFTSAAMSLSAILGVIYGLKRFAEHGMETRGAIAAATGLLIGAAFIRRQKHLSHPFIDLQLFRVPAFSAAVIVNVLSVFTAFGAFLFIHQYLQLVADLSPMRAGLWTLPSSLGFIVGSMSVSSVRRRLSDAQTLAGGILLSAIGFAVLSRTTASGGVTMIVIGSVVMALGLAPVVTMTTDLIVGSAPPERAGAASAISETGSELGGALGIAVLGSIGMASYRNRMADRVFESLPRESVDAVKGTLGGAVGVAQQLPDAVGSGMLTTAREAFTGALALTSIISAIVMVAAAVLVVIALRGRSPSAID
jgi:MFS transporter, DHA2 family, multidrug resistance protein